MPQEAQPAPANDEPVWTCSIGLPPSSTSGALASRRCTSGNGTAKWLTVAGMSAAADHATNRAFWDELAAAHGQDDYYDTRALIAGQSSLVAEEEQALAAAVGGRARLDGVDIVHVQCHIGFDAVTLARRGGRVTGVDFSPVALAKARSIAERCGVEVDWVEADVCEIPERLHGRFDLAWATVGVLCWIGDLEAWMRSVAAVLRPRGQLVLMDGHPLGKMVSTTDPLTVAMPYGGGVRLPDSDGSPYANVEVRPGPNVQFAYSLGEVVTAAADAGLRIVQLVEHLDVSFDHRSGGVHEEPDGRWRLRVDGQALPTLFTLRALRPQ
jgi:SAM-dependent methyltransferase